MLFRSPYTTPAEALTVFRRRLRIAVHRISWAYFALLLVFWGYLHFRGDRSWTGTVILFGPVWMAAVPAAILVPLALLLNRRSLGVLGLALAVALFPIMGLCLPWRTFLHQPGGGQHVRVLTCNMNRDSLNDSALSALVDEAEPEIVVLQEWPSGHRLPRFVDRNWHTREDGELFIASRYTIDRAEAFDEPNWAEWGGAVVRYDIAAPSGAIHLFNIHLASPHLQFKAVIDGKPTGGHLLETHLEVRREESRKISRMAEGYGGAAIIAGDFNSIAEGSIYRNSWKQFDDAFSCAGLGLGHTYFGEGAAVRIDHILAGDDWRFNDCRIGPDIGSPHRPLIADLERLQPR